MTHNCSAFLSLLLIALFFFSCEFRKSYQKDLISGATAIGSGLGCDAISMEINGSKESRNTFLYGETVNIVFDNVTGFTKKDGKTYPGLSLYLIKNETDTVMAHLNILDKPDAGTDLSPLQLQANFTATLPHRNNEKYQAHINIWDKKGEGTFSYEIPFTIKENDLIDIETSGAAYSNIYLWDETKQQTVTGKTISADHSYVLIVEGADGFKQTEGMVFPVFSLEIHDAKGNAILSETNLFKQYEATGINTDTFNSQLYATVRFNSGQIYNPYTLKAVLKDKKSERKIVVTTELEIE